MPFLLLEVKSADVLEIVRRWFTNQSSDLRILTTAHRLSALIESDVVQTALENEVIADVKQKHADASAKYGTSDLKLTPQLLNRIQQANAERIRKEFLEADNALSIGPTPEAIYSETQHADGTTTVRLNLGANQTMLTINVTDPPADDAADDDDDDGDTPVVLGGSD